MWLQPTLALADMQCIQKRVAPAAQTKFQTLVGELTPISFNTSIFSDAHFTALVDIATPVAPETIGRLDPFAAITGVDGK